MPVTPMRAKANVSFPFRLSFYFVVTKQCYRGAQLPLYRARNFVFTMKLYLDDKQHTNEFLHMITHRSHAVQSATELYLTLKSPHFVHVEALLNVTIIMMMIILPSLNPLNKVLYF